MERALGEKTILTCTQEQSSSHDPWPVDKHGSSLTSTFKTPQPALTITCRQIREEASPFFYASGSFTATEASCHCCPSATASLGSWLHRIHKHTHHIERITITKFFGIGETKLQGLPVRLRVVLRGDRRHQRPIEITYAAKAPNFKSAGDVILRRMEEAMARFGGL
ncbi:hypothetical protein LTR09_011183 [Extremus antarcticus]|uniref:Uncharacterized protein n=1 Tax=Extremus antarcticus TaxID=702011 RepID=A0AAJ0D6K4_9PEZI|nr:hypothetical protein LTR09_011183 [Extremus antarcticus]